MSEVKKSAELQDDVSVTEENENDSESPKEEIEVETVEGEEIQSVESELAEAKATIVELQDRILRAAAENENFKKRVERERLAGLKYAGETIFRELLPVVDNLERALEQGVVEGADAEQNLAGLLEGIQLTWKNLVATLEKFEVKQIDSVGKPFDPQHQEALTMGKSETVPANHVITEFEKGYYYKDRLLRAAKVVVSSGKNEDEESA
ncbi:MAG: nucleotide exchange factor GrpE [Desulforhopalus sp.]